MLLCCCRIEQWHWDLSHLWSSQDRNYHCLFTLTWQCGDLFESTQHRQITTHSYRKRREGVTLIFRVVTACRCVGCNIRLYQHFDRGHCLLVVGTYFFETSVTCCDTTWRNSFFSFLVQLPGSYCLLSTPIWQRSLTAPSGTTCMSCATGISQLVQRLASGLKDSWVRSKSFSSSSKRPRTTRCPRPFSGNRGLFHCG